MLYVEKIIVDNMGYVHTWSDKFLIERDGAIYSDAIDPVDSGREYTETDTPLNTLSLEEPSA